MQFSRQGLEGSITSRVVRHQSVNRHEDVRLVLDDGSEMTVPRQAWANALRDTVQAMSPALPGTAVIAASELEYAQPDEPFMVWRRTVVAWAVSADGGTHPVTARGVNDGQDDEVTVLHADGSVEGPAGRWNTYDEWEASERAEYEAGVTRMLAA